MLVVAEVLARHAAFVPTIAGHRRPGELERQQSQHEDCKPTTHCEECSSYKDWRWSDWRWSDEDKGVSPIRTRRFPAFRHALKKLEGENMSRRRCGGTSRQALPPAATFTVGADTKCELFSAGANTYTYNKGVNRLSVVQEHRMIVRAAERDVSVQQLADVLAVSPGAIRQQFKLLDGICSEAGSLLADKPATHGMFKVLKQMKPFRQIDVAQTMINLNNYTIKLALAMLQATPPEQLTEAATAKGQRAGPTEALQRLQRELAAVQADTKLLEEGYGPANLQLEIIKTYVGKTLLENAAVVRWLAKTHAEYLQQLQLIAEIKQLPTQ
ncbi:plasmid partitioning protein RepB C-terminal domain-containing protein [Ideonella sp.]|uniref:plasmid partitioning protein RepB C-terminal domain-containing protein n=1 Tax=Ideonella sp. TaxID=1929293 RepID=UPI003BB73E38